MSTHPQPQPEPDIQELRRKAAAREAVKRNARLDEFIRDEAIRENIDIDLDELKFRLDPGLRGMLALIRSAEDSGPPDPLAS